VTASREADGDADSVGSGVRAFLALGSNMGDRRSILANAIRCVPDLVAVSGLYETEPVGGPEQGAFLNLVIELSTDLDPWELLALCEKLEGDAERVRLVRWGPRTLDVDVLLYEDQVVDDSRLTIPHPRMWQRRFVLQPLADLAPELMPGGWAQAVEDQEVERVGDLDLS
jgi:2-amino-4-hydroxy-6-hydroxymethyldihydropteridine diphosphokinase